MVQILEQFSYIINTAEHYREVLEEDSSMNRKVVRNFSISGSAWNHEHWIFAASPQTGTTVTLVG